MAAFVPPSQLNTSNPGTWPLFYKLLSWCAIIAASAFLYSQFLRTPLIEEQDANDSKIGQLKADYKKLYQYTLDLPKYQERSRELVNILKSLLAYLPSQSEMPNLIDQVYESAVDNGINFQIFQPERDIKRTYFDVKPIRLEAETSYGNFAHFAEKISALQRILNISDMNFTVVDGTTNKLKISSQLQTYIYNQNIDELLNGDGGTNNANK